MDLVAIYHCGKQADAAPAEVLSRFREKYPACAAVMINDGGDQVLKSFANMFHCEYAPCSNVSKNPLSIELETAYDAIKYVERILAAIPDHDGWVLLLEDDVWVYNQVVLTQLRFDMCGGYSGLTLPPSVCIRIGQRRKNFPRRGAACAKTGGAFLRVSFLRVMRDDANWQKNVDLLFLDQPSFSSGTLLSALVYMEGGTVGPYSGYFEPGFLSFKLFSVMGQGVVQYKCKILGNQRKKFSIQENEQHAVHDAHATVLHGAPAHGH